MIIGKLIFGVAAGAAKDIVSEVGGQKLDELKSVAKCALGDTIQGIMGGRRTLDEWCEIAAPSVDAALSKTLAEDNLKYAGGYLSFSFSDSMKKSVSISYELYFLDEEKQWIKQAATGSARASTFTQDALAEITNQGTVKFDVEE